MDANDSRQCPLDRRIVGGNRGRKRSQALPASRALEGGCLSQQQHRELFVRDDGDALIEGAFIRFSSAPVLHQA